MIDLIPDKDAVFAELYCVLRPGGRMQLADVTIQRPVSEEGRRNIDLWTGVDPENIANRKKMA